MRCARTGLLTNGRPLALLATAPACPTPAQDGLRVGRGSCHRRAAFRTSQAHRTEPLTKPGDALCRAMSARTRTAPMVGHRPDRQRFSHSHPPRAHGDPRALGGDGDTRIHPSGRPGLIRTFHLRTSPVFRNSSTSLSRGQTNHTTNRGKPDAPSLSLTGRSYRTRHPRHKSSAQPADRRSALRNRARIPSRLDATASYCTRKHFTA